MVGWLVFDYLHSDRRLFGVAWITSQNLPESSTPEKVCDLIGLPI
jgi:hypothetical protein